VFVAQSRKRRNKSDLECYNCKNKGHTITFAQQSALILSKLNVGQREAVRTVKDQSETSALPGRRQGKGLEREVRLGVKKECGTTPRQVREDNGGYDNTFSPCFVVRNMWLKYM
jgi:hypothetical protein